MPTPPMSNPSPCPCYTNLIMDTSLGKKGLARPLRELRGAFMTDPVFKGLVTPVGIMAPGHGIELRVLSSTYFDKYVTYCWKHWKDNTLTFEYPKGATWTGKVGDDDRLALTGTVNSEAETHYIARPPSKDIFFCNGVFDAVIMPPPITGYVGRDTDLKNQISSALNRTVMHLPPIPPPPPPSFLGSHINHPAALGEPVLPAERTY